MMLSRELERDRCAGRLVGQILPWVDFGALARSSHELSRGIRQVSAAVAEMDKVVQGGAASSEEIILG